MTWKKDHRRTHSML